MKTTLTLIISFMVMQSAYSQHKEIIEKEFEFEQKSLSNVFQLANINGSIKVEAYDGDKILLVAKKEINAKTPDRLEKARDELSIGIIDRLDTIVVYIKSPYERFDKKVEGNSVVWGYRGFNSNDRKYDFNFDFTLKVPRNVNLYLSTINDGDIDVIGIKGSLDVHNINGSISLMKISGKTSAHTINGDVTLDYAVLPDQASEYYTLNGDINAFYPKGLKADMSFKSFNGEFFTNIERVDQQMVVEKEKRDGEGLAYKIGGRSLITAGGGGISLDFETFNGDVTVKEK